MCKTYRKYNCVHCGEDTFDLYMVHNELWDSLGLKRYGDVCHFECLEVLLGRQITLDDLMDVPINNFLEYIISTRSN